MRLIERRFTAAIARLPGPNFADGLRRVELGAPDLPLALAQHRSYCEALQSCGLELTILPADTQYPDGTFVEDTAVIVAGAALLTRPGAPSRRNETAAIAPVLRKLGVDVAVMAAPATLDGGDICAVGDHVFIGLSERSNAEGAAQLGQWLQQLGYMCSTIDIRGMASILHLKSGLADLGDSRLLVIDELAAHPALVGRALVRVDAAEAYAANALRVNEHVLIAGGYPRLRQRLDQLGYRTIALDMSEFAKLDGGLSCLSLRF